MATDPHNIATVPISIDPWAPFTKRCQDDAKDYVTAAIHRARLEDGHPMPSGCVTAGLDALTMLYGTLMAENAKLRAEVERMRDQVSRRPGWWRQIFRPMGHA
jgi:hypothetical protein